MKGFTHGSAVSLLHVFYSQNPAFHGYTGVAYVLSLLFEPRDETRIIAKIGKETCLTEFSMCTVSLIDDSYYNMTEIYVPKRKEDAQLSSYCSADAICRCRTTCFTTGLL